MVERTVVEWAAHPAQSRILRSTARFPIACCGRRFGKSEGGIAFLLLEGASLVEQGHEPSSLDLWWCADTYEHASEALEKITKPTTPQGKPNPFKHIVRHATYSPGDMRLTTRGGYEIEFRTAERTGALVAAGVHAAVADEAAAWRERSWDAELRPALADTMGRCLLISTPKGRNWFHRAFLMGREKRGGYEAFHAPSHGNPFLSRAELVALQESMTPRAYRQEILAEFLDDAGAFFRNVRSRIVPGNARGPDLEPPSRGEHWAGWDPAKHQDWSVLCIVRGAKRRLVHFDRSQGVDYLQQCRRVDAACRRYGVTVLAMDATGAGDPLFDMMTRLSDGAYQVLPFKFTSTSKSDLVNGLSLSIDDASVEYPDVPELVNELEVYEAKDDQGTKSGAPEGMHDDCVIGLALAVHASKAQRSLEVW